MSEGQKVQSGNKIHNSVSLGPRRMYAPQVQACVYGISGALLFKARSISGTELDFIPQLGSMLHLSVKDAE